MATFGPYPAAVMSIHDGDTMRVSVDLGFDVATSQNCRVHGINAPELGTPAGKESLAYAQTLVTVGDRVTTVSHGWDKYGGRYDGDITLSDGRDFATEMLNAGHAVVMK